MLASVLYGPSRLTSDSQVGVVAVGVVAKLAADSSRARLSQERFVDAGPASYGGFSVRRADQILLAIWIAYYSAVYWNVNLVKPALPRQTDEELGKDFELQQFFSSITGALGLAGSVFQAYLNHRSKTFAGSYRVSAFIGMVSHLTRVVYLLPVVIGHFAASEGMNLVALSHLAMEAVFVHQALTLPRVEQRGEEDEE